MNPYDPDGRAPWHATRPRGHVDPDAHLELDEGEKHAVNGRMAISVLGEGRLFKRRAIKGVGSGEGAPQLTWVVGEVDGVRCYAVPLDGKVHIILTREDIYP